MNHVRTVIARAVRTRVRAIRHSEREDGWALVIALTLMVMAIGFGTAILAVADTQSKASAVSRQRDAATSLADAALNAEMFSLANNWPGPGSALGPNQTQPAGPYPPCTPTATDSRCPSAAVLQNLINSPDTINSGVSWQINVYDDDIVNGQSLQTFYSDKYTAGQVAYDGNNNGKVWVRAQATVGNVTKTVVAMVQAQYRTIPLPRDVVLAGSLQTGNQGNKVIINTQGSAGPGSAAPVLVRCNPALSATCLQYDSTHAINQIAPDTASGNSTAGNAISAADQAALKAQAQANGTYYATCPANMPSGPVVWIDSGNCSWTGNATLNSSTSPGVIIINNGTINVAGTLTYYGLLYGINAQGSSGTVIGTGGNAQVIGAIMVDGNGGVGAASSKLNVQFDPNAVAGINTVSNASYIQTTWREL
jgi:Tfp pilus assembly protein PilX